MQEAAVYIITGLIALIGTTISCIIICEIIRYYCVKSLISIIFVPVSDNKFIPIPFSSLAILGKRGSVRDKIFSSIGQDIFLSRQRLADKYNTYFLSYHWSLSHLNFFNFIPKNFYPRIIVTNVMLCPIILNNPEIWVKHPDNPTVSRIIGQSCTRAVGKVAIRQRRALHNALKGRQYFLKCIHNAGDILVGQLTSYLTETHREIITPPSAITNKIDGNTDSIKAPTGRVVDIMPILHETTLSLMMRLIFGDPTNTVQEFMNIYYHYWDILRVNHINYSTYQRRKRRKELATYIEKLRILIYNIVDERMKRLFNENIYTLNDINRLKESCILDKLIVQMKIERKVSNIQKAPIDELIHENSVNNEISVESTDATTISVSDIENKREMCLMQKKSERDIERGRNEDKIDIRKQTVKEEEEEKEESVYLSEEELVHNLYSLVTAGFETTAHTLAVCLLLLAYHEDIQSTIANCSISENTDSSSSSSSNHSKRLVKAVVKESLRLYPPVPQIVRVCNRATVFEGVECVQGTVATVDVIGMQRSKKHWGEDADCFSISRWGCSGFSSYDPSSIGKMSKRSYCSLGVATLVSSASCVSVDSLRQTTAHETRADMSIDLDADSRKHWLPFGTGPQQCIGQSLAMMIVENMLTRVLCNFSVRPDSEFIPHFSQSATLRLHELTLLLNTR